MFCRAFFRDRRDLPRDLVRVRAWVVLVLVLVVAVLAPLCLLLVGNVTRLVLSFASIHFNNTRPGQRVTNVVVDVVVGKRMQKGVLLSTDDMYKEQRAAYVFFISCMVFASVKNRPGT